MNATIYKSLSNKSEIATVSPGQSVAAAFPDIDFANAVIIVNGEERTADYVLREFDVLTIRELPAGATAIAVGIIVAIAIGTGVYAGVQIYKAKKAAEEAQKELEKVKKQSNNDSIDNRPFLRGASNTPASGKSQPYVCGRHLLTPYLLCSPFYKITGTDGADEYTYIALACGFNKQIIHKIAVEDVVIKTFGGTSPQEGAYDIDDGIFAQDGRIEIAQDGNPFGELTSLNYKVVSNNCNDEIPRDAKVEAGDAEYLTYTLDANAMSVEVAITFPYGLHAYNDEGTKIATQVTITTQYSLDGGETWVNIKEHLFNRNVSSKELRFTESHGFEWHDYDVLHDNGQTNILLRVRSNGNDDPKIKNDCYVMFYQSKCFDPEKSTYPAGSAHNTKWELVPCKIIEDRERAFCTIIGLKLKASALNEDKLKKVNIITQGMARTWNGARWSEGKSATRNAAAWALEILTSESHPMSRFADGEIDMASFGDFYEHCEENGFYFDYVITQGRKKGDTIDMILQNCGATLYRDLYGRLAVAIDRAQSNAVAVYNPQNIISIQNKKTFGRRTDGLRIKYVSSENDLYQEDTYLLMREAGGKPLELNSDSAIRDVTVTGITTFKHVVKYARRMMAIEALRPKTTTIEVGNEGVYFTPYSKVLIQDDSLKIGTGNGVIKATQWENGLLKRIVLDCPVTFESGKMYGATVNCFGGGNNAVPLSVKVSGEGHTDLLTLETSVPDTSPAIPEIGCVVSFGELDSVGTFNRITTPYLISGISRSDKGFRLELVNYNLSIYSSGTIPDYRSNITQKPPVRNDPIPPDFVTKTEMMDAITNGIDTSVEQPDKPTVSECSAGRDYISARFDPLPEADRNTLRNVEWQVNKGHGWEDFYSNISFSARYDFDRRTDGYPEREDLAWQVRCRVTNTRGIASEWSEPLAVDTSGYGTWRVSTAKDARAKTEGSDSISLRFSAGRTGTRQYYGSTSFTVIVKYDGNPMRTEADVPFGLYHYFDRDTEGYPERHENAADGIRDLSLYSFTIRPVESVTGETGEDVTVSVDDSSYGTWLIPPVETSADAGEHLVTLRWSMDGAAPYGKMRYDVYLGGEPLKEGLTASYYAYRFTDNLTKEEVGALEFSVRARNEAHERTEAFSVDASNYLGYAIEKPWIRAKARKEGIDVSWDRTNDFYGKCEFVLLKDGEEAFRSAKEREFFLPFGEDEFPEKDDIAGIELKVLIEGDADAAESDAAETDTSGYLTYIPSVPTAYTSASGRNANLSWDSQDGVYGFSGCDVQIAKAYNAADGKMIPITDEDGLEWYAPALGLNPYESLDNYRRGDAGGYLEVKGNSVSFTLPLFGQDGGGAEDTPYAFRLRGRSAAGKTSEWTEARFVVCRAISAYDVTKAWDLDDAGERVKLPGALGAYQIFAEELSAISANLGYITDGALKGNAYNYWAVGDVMMDDGSMLWRGAFRVGGKDQYILVTPRLEDGAPTGEYDITFVVGNFSVSASGTRIEGGAFEVCDADGNLMFRAAPDGSSIRVATGEFNSKETEAEIAVAAFNTDDGIEPYFLTVKDGCDAYVIVPRLAGGDDPEGMYEADVYKAGASSCEKAWTMDGYAAYSLCLTIQFMNYALAEDGKFSFYGISVDAEGGEMMMMGVYEADMRGHAVSFTPFNADDDMFQGYIPYRILTVGGRIFLYCDKDGSAGGTYRTFRAMFLMTEQGVARMTPGDGEYDLLGVAVRGGYAYCAFQSYMFTMVVRRDLATGASEACAFVGAVSSDKELSPYANGVMVDDDHVTLFGRATLLDADGSAALPPFLGAVRIPLSSAAWQYWDGASELPDGFATTTGIEAYRYGDAADDVYFIPCHAAMLENDPLAAVVTSYNDSFKADVFRLAFEDSGEPEGVLGGAVIGALAVSQQVDSIAPNPLDIEGYYRAMYRACAYAGVYGAAFPQSVGGIGAVRSAYPSPRLSGTDITGFSVSVRTVFDEQRNEVTGSGVYSAGIGFNVISHDTASGKYRYYLDTGAYIEFNEDGTLSAQTGPQGTPGRDGKDGADGTALMSHNVPRLVPKDITEYYEDGSLWDRIAGTGGRSLHEDVYVGDYFKMSRPISAREKTGQYQTTGSQYVTIAGLDVMMGNGDSNPIDYHHAVMVPGQGFGGTQHFGRARMNPTNSTTGGYKSSEMNTETIGAVASAGSTAANASINQQLVAEFGSHLKTTRELVSNAVNATGNNRFGNAGGCSSAWEWNSMQAILMSEVECYGSIVWSSSGFDTGNACSQMPLFVFSKEARNNRSAYYWLKDVASAAWFCTSGNDSSADYYDASLVYCYVRPRFILA